MKHAIGYLCFRESNQVLREVQKAEKIGRLQNLFQGLKPASVTFYIDEVPVGAPQHQLRHNLPDKLYGNTILAASGSWAVSCPKSWTR